MSGATYITLASLKSMEIKLAGFSFCRSHKSYIINKDQIHSFSHSEIKMNNGKQIPIGRVYRKTVLNELNK